jgi:hypothetical protein
MGDSQYYGYDGDRVGTLKKMMKKVVSIEKDWIVTVHKQFADQGYSALLKTVKHWVREGHGEEMSDAQAWILIHAITNEGVPMALRDASHDEKINPVKYVAGSALGMVDRAVDTTVGGVKAAGKAAGSAATHMSKPFNKDSTEE